MTENKTISILLGEETKKFLFFTWPHQRFQEYKWEEGIALFEDKFLSYPDKIIVFHPERSPITPSRAAAYTFIPLKETIAILKRNSRVSGFKVDRRFPGASKQEKKHLLGISDEIALYKQLMDLLSKNEQAEVAYVPKGLITECNVWGINTMQSISHIAASANIMTKEACYELIREDLLRVLDNREDKRPAGITLPHNGEGIFIVQSD